MQRYLPYFLLLYLSIVAFSSYSVTVTARGKFNSLDHEAFSQLPTKTLFKKGTAYLEEALTEPDSAMLCFSIIVNRYDTHPTPDEAPMAVGSLINISYLWSEAYYDYARSYGTNLKALKIAEENIEDATIKTYLPYIYIGMASILQYIDINDSPLESPNVWFGKALKAAIATNNDMLMRNSIMNLCEMAITNGMTDSLRENLNLIKTYNIEHSITYDDHTTCFLAATECLNNNDREGVIRQLDKALVLTPADRSTDEKVRLMTLKLKIITMRDNGDNDSVPMLLKSMLNSANDRNYQEFTLYALKELATYYAKTGNRDAAHQFDYMYLHANDSLQRHNNITRVKDMAFLSSLEKAEDNVRQITIKKKQNETVTLFIVSFAVLIIVSLILYIRNQKKLNEANLSLYKRLQNDLNQKDTPIKIDITHTNATPNEERSKNEDPSPSGGISPEHAEEIFSKVKQIMESSPKIYEDDFSLRTLASMTDTPYYALSAAINYCSGSNFKTLLMGYRLREACRRLSNNANDQTIESIALSLGFKSRTYFISIFKKHTGLTPSVYTKIAHAKQETN